MKDQETSTSDKQRSKGGFAGLIAILVGILLGVLVGVFYGKAMWVSSGGIEKKIDILQKTAEQKATFAAADEKEAFQLEKKEPHKAKKLLLLAKKRRSHIPHIRADIKQLKIDLKLHKEKLGLGKAGGKPDDVYQFKNSLAATARELIEFLGDLFLQVLKLLVIPLVVTSMICGITALGDVRKVGRMGAWTVGYYMITGGIAVLIGICLVLAIQPGKTADDTYAYVPPRVEKKKDATVLQTMLDVFRGKEDANGNRDPGSGMFPSNIFHAATSTNVLALIVFALVFGGALTTLGEQGKIVIQFFVATNEAIMKMVHMVMLVAPIGIFALVANNITKNGGGDAFYEELTRISSYAFTVMIGLALHSLVLATILAVLGKRNPLKYTYGLLRALLTAMSTASSSATLPVTMECVEENNKVSNRSASFVLPLGATVNMDGTALYEAVAVIFIAQTLDMDLSLAQLVVIFLTATLAAVGAAGIPEAGLVTMVIVLAAVGVPMSGIGTILAIDWFLDRMRTTVNVYGDAVGAGVVDQVVGTTAHS